MLNPLRNENDRLPMLALCALFLVVSHVETYKLVQNVINMVLPNVRTLDDQNNPTLVGYVLHTLVFLLLVVVVNNQLFNCAC